MDIKTIQVGYLQTNCYIIMNEETQLVIDPGAEAEKIIANLTDPQAILITHYHDDHIGALQQIKQKYNIPVIDYTSKENQQIKNINFEVIKTPGHHETQVMFKFDNIAFTGDFIFKSTIGRTDLATGDMQQMQKSLENLKKYSNLTLYPGHGPKTTLEQELKTNPYLI